LIYADVLRRLKSFKHSNPNKYNTDIFSLKLRSGVVDLAGAHALMRRDGPGHAGQSRRRHYQRPLRFQRNLLSPW